MPNMPRTTSSTYKFEVWTHILRNFCEDEDENEDEDEADFYAYLETLSST